MTISNHISYFKKSPFSNAALGKDLWSSNGGLQQNHQSVTQPLSQTGPPPISWSLPYSFYFFATYFLHIFIFLKHFPLACYPFAILYPIICSFPIILSFFSSWNRCHCLSVTIRPTPHLLVPSPSLFISHLFADCSWGQIHKSVSHIYLLHPDQFNKTLDPNMTKSFQSSFQAFCLTLLNQVN